MIIANPIYDVIFKYLMEDTDIAKELLSTILSVKIVDLTVKPQETVVKSDNGYIRIFRLDFKATILLETGKQKVVLIELQKAKQTYDIVRFRKYLGKNYQQPEVRKNATGMSEDYSLEIITIYFLGFELEKVPVPILKVERNYIDVVSGKELPFIDDDFINLLTHESYTIQIPRLRLDQQSEIEQVLEIFSQKYVTNDLHSLDFKGKQTHPLVLKMARRLLKAISNTRLRRRMDAEDELDRVIGRALAKNQKENDEKMIEKDILLGEKDSIIEEKDSIIEEKDSIIEEKDSIIEEKEQENQRLRKALEKMLNQNKK